MHGRPWPPTQLSVVPVPGTGHSLLPGGNTSSIVLTFLPDSVLVVKTWNNCKCSAYYAVTLNRRVSIIVMNSGSQLSTISHKFLSSLSWSLYLPLSVSV